MTHPKSIIYIWLCNATRFKNSELRGIFAILESILESDLCDFKWCLWVEKLAVIFGCVTNSEKILISGLGGEQGRWQNVLSEEHPLLTLERVLTQHSPSPSSFYFPTYTILFLQPSLLFSKFSKQQSQVPNLSSHRHCHISLYDGRL
jgi:hypothetical protein